MTETKEIIAQAKQGFTRDLFTPGYDKIIADAEHLSKLIKFGEFKSGKNYLDIGTGAGYIAFELARQFPNIGVTGIDIVEPIIAVNNQKVQAQNYQNLKFLSYEGTHFPFEDNSFHGALSRYAFHHFPLPDVSASEIYRVLEPGGFCIIDDLTTDMADEENFVNQFAALKHDGHVSYHNESALINFFEQAGFKVEDKFYSAITFPRDPNDDYTKLLAKTAPQILDIYKVNVTETVIYITVQVLNIRFRK